MADEEEELDDTEELCPECGESIENCECERCEDCKHLVEDCICEDDDDALNDSDGSEDANDEEDEVE